MHTRMYLADCPAALSSAYAYTYVPSRVPSRSLRRPAALLGCQFALSDANSLSQKPIRSFTRDVTRPERRLPWLGSGWESQEFCGLSSLYALQAPAYVTTPSSRSLSLFL